MREPGNAMKRWKMLAVLWPLLCIVFFGIIVSQTGRGTEERIADAGFTLFPLIFFAIGMRVRRRLLKERANATILTTAAVVSVNSRILVGEGNKRCYFPEYEFQAKGRAYRVKSPSGFSHCYVRQGDRVDLYYAPEDPRLFYVPIMQKHDKRWAALLCGVGIAFPLVGLFAPQIRALCYFLE